jgi:V8-like Glu-specific endopeptidase
MFGRFTPTLSSMAHPFIGQRAAVLAALGCAAVLAVSCRSGNQDVPGPTTPSGPTTLTPCGVVSGSAAGSLAIVNGSSCPESTASVAYLKLKDKNGDLYATCSGTVISSTAVLTAAHCLDGTSGVTINFGDKKIEASSFFAHPDYKGTDSDSVDVGVVIASSPIGQPIMPLLASRNARTGETVVIAGYGQSTLGAGAGTLRAGATTMSEVGTYYLVTNAGLNGSGACPGDSGGPVMVSIDGYWAVAGAASTLSGPCVVATNRFANIRNPAAWSFILSKAPDAAQR